MNTILRIAGLSIHIKSEESFAIKRLLPFLSTDEKNPDVLLTIKRSDFIPHPEGRIILDDELKWLLKKDTKAEFCIYAVDETDGIYYMLETNNLWSSGAIFYDVGRTAGKFTDARPLIEVLFRNRILFHKGIVIHAAAIAWQNKGIIFSAPSETGKSTQANLWKTHMNATILNEDRPAVRIDSTYPELYGTPWAGTYGEYINAFAPLSAIVLLEQASDNSIRELPYKESLLKIMARSFLPYYSRDMMDIALQNLESIIRAVPVYLLKCTPDKRAMEILWPLIK